MLQLFRHRRRDFRVPTSARGASLPRYSFQFPPHQYGDMANTIKMNISYSDTHLAPQRFVGTVFRRECLATDSFPRAMSGFIIAKIYPPRLTSVNHISHNNLEILLAQISSANSINLWTGLEANCARRPKNRQPDPVGACLAAPLDKSHNRQTAYRK